MILKNKMIKDYYLELMDEFEIKGFVKCPSGNQSLNKLREQYGEYLKIFNSGYNISVGRTGAKYGTYDIFGDRTCYYYDIRKEKEFVNYLVEKFYEKNPDPDKEIRKVFTRILHIHRLHWFGCRHGGKIRYDINKTELNNSKEYDLS